MFTVGVPHIDEDIQPGWWRKTGGAVAVEEEEEIVFPDLVVGDENEAGTGIQAGGMGAGELAVGGGAGEPRAGAGAGAGAGQPEDGEPGAGVGDEAGELGVNPPAGAAEHEILPELMEDSSADEDDGDGPTGDDDAWDPADDAPVNPVRGGVVAAVDMGAENVVDVVDGDAHVVDESGHGQPFIPRRSNREKRGVPPIKFIEMYLASAAEEEVKQSPKSVQEALEGKHGNKWQVAMDSEMNSLQDNGVFELVDRLVGRKVVKSKWVLRVKTNERGEVEKYKARVVAKGYSQVEGVDYDQMFSPTVRFESIRQMVALGASKAMSMHQMNVTTAFLYAPPEEEVYMEQPEGTVKEGD